MASEHQSEDPVALVRRLMEQGKTFSISLEAPRSLLVETVRRGAHNFTVAAGDGDCVQWVYVPGVGSVCVKHGG